MMSGTLSISERIFGDVTVVSLDGRLDTTTASDAEASLLSLLGAGRQKIVINARNLEYISSAGLRVLLAAKKKLGSGSGDIRLAAMSPQIRNIFAITGFDRIFLLFDDEGQALASFS
jgi:anti-sigma B factor antagonist